MNPKINKISGEIERTRAKIVELEALLPELERKKTALENDEIIKQVRSASVLPGDISTVLNAIRATAGPPTEYIEETDNVKD